MPPSIHPHLNVTEFRVYFISKRFQEVLEMMPEAIQSSSVWIGDEHIEGPKYLGGALSMEDAITIAEKAYDPEHGEVKIDVCRYECYKCKEEHPDVYIGEPYTGDNELAGTSYIKATCQHSAGQGAPRVHQTLTYCPKQAAEAAVSK